MLQIQHHPTPIVQMGCSDAYEAASFVEVDVTEALGAVGVGEDNFALEDVGVFGGVAGGGLGAREV
jgi:hypothetical protein